MAVKDRLSDGNDDGPTPVWDVFISHAKEDKKQVAQPLAHELRKRGLTVWYDEFSLTLGDGLRQTIDEGLAKSRFGVVVLSVKFFAKEWTKRELEGLISRETGAGKVVLPILHGVSYDDLARFSPILAGRLGIKSEEGVSAMADAIEKAIRGQTGLADSKRATGQSQSLSPGASAIGRTEYLEGTQNRMSSSWNSLRSKAIPTLLVLWVQWILAVFLLYLDSFYLGLFGFAGPLWLIPLGYLTARFVAREVSVARIVGGLLGGIVGAAISLGISERAARYGVSFGAFFGVFVSAYFSDRERETKVIWAALSILIMVALEVVNAPDSYRYIPGYAFVGTVFPIVVGFLLVVSVRLSKTVRDEENEERTSRTPLRGGRFKRK
jgi:hypothetical protein